MGYIHSPTLKIEVIMARFLFFVVLLLTALPQPGLAELMSRFAPGFGPKVEKITGVQTYVSSNGTYELVMNGPEGKWSLKENGRLLWSKYLPSQPGAAAISDDGNMITQPMWQYIDEVHCLCSGIVFYNREGESVRYIHFLDGWQSLLLSLDQIAISPDGSMIVIGGNGKPKSYLTMINGADGVKSWDISTGYATVDALRMTSKGAYTLVATHDGRNMEFLLLDHKGRLIWSRKIANNYSTEIRDYVRFDRDEKGFFIHVLASETFQHHVIPAPKVP
jgi:hypothetical protein